MKAPLSVYLIAATVALTGLAWPLSHCAAAEQSATDPTGTWKISAAPGSATGFEPTLKLKLEKGKLSGTLSGLKNSSLIELPLEEARLQGNEISFTTRRAAASYSQGVRQKDQTNVVSISKYRGANNGTLIQGTVEKEVLGKTHTSEWQAKRVKE